MSERHPHGEVRADVVDSHILKAVIDRPRNKSASSPKLVLGLGDVPRQLDGTPVQGPPSRTK